MAHEKGKIHENRLAVAGSQPHRRSVKGESRLDERLESPLGRLFFYSIISLDEYEAGKKYRQASLDYKSSIGAPYPFAESVDNMDAIAGPMAMPSDEQCLQRKQSFDILRKVIENRKTEKFPAYRVLWAMEKLVIYEDGPRGAYMQSAAIIGLKWLAEHFKNKRNLKGKNLIPFSKFGTASEIYGSAPRNFDKTKFGVAVVYSAD